MRRYVLVGSGAAGVAAAEAIRSQDAQGEIILISEEKEGYYSRPGLAYYLTNELPEKQLYPFNQSDFKRLNLKFLRGRVIGIDAQEHKIESETGKQLTYDKLLIATGARANMPEMSGMDLGGVVKLDSLRDARELVKRARKSRSAVVVGGGITALELVEGLRARSVRTHYLLRKDRYWGNVLDETESKIVLSRLKKEGVRVHFNTQIKGLIGSKGQLKAVLCSDDKQIKANLAAFAIGIRPRLHLAHSAGIRTDRGIVVDEYLQSSHADIYAAGDAAQVYDPVRDEAVLDSLWWPARKQGHTAGLNMSGQRVAYHKSVPYNVTRLAGLTTTIIGEVGAGQDEDLFGIARGDSETWRGVPEAIASQSHFDVNRIRLMVGEKTLRGALIMGDQTISPYVQEMVTAQADITPIRELLMTPKAKIADIIVQFWTPRRQAHAARGA